MSPDGHHDIERCFAELRTMSSTFAKPMVDAMVETGRDPFKVLVATLLSLRTKDEVTEAASRRLFARADTPVAMIELSAQDVAALIRPVGFHRTKAGTVLRVCRELIDRFGGSVPDDEEALLSMKGVGRKTANLVLSAAFERDAICVDTHVHRITNRWGYVTTKTADHTEMALRQRLPRHLWRQINGLLVAFGQNLCTPISPWCSQCSLRSWWCEGRGVTTRR